MPLFLLVFILEEKSGRGPVSGRPLEYAFPRRSLKLGVDILLLSLLLRCHEGALSLSRHVWQK